MKKSSSVNEYVSLEEHSDTSFTPIKGNQHYSKLDSTLQQYRVAIIIFGKIKVMMLLKTK